MSYRIVPILSSTKDSIHCDKNGSIRAVAQDIFKGDGLRGFWSGYSASLVLTLNPSLTFFVYEILKRFSMPRNHWRNPSLGEIFFISALSKVLASTLIYPFSFAKSILQSKKRDSDKKNKGPQTPRFTSSQAAQASKQQGNLLTVIMGIIEVDGLRALYDGVGGEILKGFFSHGIAMLLKETIYKFVVRSFHIMLRITKRYPSPERLAELAKERTKQTVRDLSNHVP